MRIVLQRVSEASVKIDNQIVGEISQGLLLLVGIEHEDEKSDADWLIQKVIGMRVFSDSDDKMNLSIQEINGEFLVVSQFTLFASTKKGTGRVLLKQQDLKLQFLYMTIFVNNFNRLQKLRCKLGNLVQT